MSFAVVAILTALPVSGAVCAMLCEYGTADSSSMASGHHHGSTHTATTDHSPGEWRISGVSGQDCHGYSDALRQASTTAERADRVVRSASVMATGALTTTITLPVRSGPHLEYGAPGTAPPTATPLVLRV